MGDIKMHCLHTNCDRAGNILSLVVNEDTVDGRELQLFAAIEVGAGIGFEQMRIGCIDDKNPQQNQQPSNHDNLSMGNNSVDTIVLTQCIEIIDGNTGKPHRHAAICRSE